MTRMKDPPGSAARCRSCEALIVWTRTESGKQMPVDLTPRESGDFFLFRRTDHIAAIHVNSKNNGDLAARARERGDNRYTSHFSTCPKAAEHRRPRS